MPSHRTTAGAAAATVVTALICLTGCNSGTVKAVSDSKSFDYTATKVTIDTREAGLVIDNGASGKITVDRTLKGNAAGDGASTMSLAGGVLKLWVECSGVTFGCEGQHTVHVPPGIAIELIGSGSPVQGTGLSGSLHATLHNDASIKLTNPSGDVGIECSGGAVDVSGARSAVVKAIVSADGNVQLGFATAPTTVEARSTGGSSTVTLPAGPETYRIDAPAAGGGVPSDPASKRSVLLRSGEGRSTVKKAG